MISVWRIVDSRFTSTAFLGEGARLYGGRWNQRGIPVVYVSESQSLAVLEQVVHLGRHARRIPFSIIKVKIPARVAIANVPHLPADWCSEPPPDSTKNIGTLWFTEGKTAVLKVPSVIAPSEHNYILNPSHPDFRRIRIGTAEPFSLDPRLWKRTP